MRNSTKKITAIAAALLLSVSGVATTAAMAAPVFAVTTGETASAATALSVTNGAGATQTIKSIAFDNGTQVDGDKLTYTAEGSVLSTTNGFTYSFGDEIRPLDDATITITLNDDTVLKLEANEYNVEYKNNTDVTAKATVTVTVSDMPVTALTTNDGDDYDTYTVTGSQTFTFAIKAYDLDKASTVDAKSVKVTWVPGKATLNVSDFPLYYTNSNGVRTAIDSSLYTVSAIGSATNFGVKNGVITFDCPDPSDTALDVSFAVASAKVTNVTASSAKATGVVLVEKANWNDVVIEVNAQTGVSTPNVTVTLNGVELTTGGTAASGTHVVVKSEKTDDATVAKVTITPNTTYFDVADGYKEEYFAQVGTNITSKISKVALTDAKTTSYTYTGAEIKPDVTVTAKNGVTLTEGTDYEIVYEDNTEVGQATFYVKGIGAYAGTTTAQHFTIKQAKLSDATVTAEDVTYETTLPTLAQLAKAITVKYGDVELVYGTDFTVTGGTVKEGENTLKILPLVKDGATSANFVGATTATVNVVKVADISTAEIATIANVAYTGEAQTPALKVTLGDKELVEGTDYTVEYTNNTEVGCATATITGIGAYTGTNARNFVIVPQQVTGLKAVKKTATTLKLQFNAVEGADGYKIYDAVTGKAIASVSTQNGADVLKKTITGLNAGETRKYKVRAYKIVNGTKRYAEYSAVYTKATAKK
jgi:hypothetical protein